MWCHWPGPVGPVNKPMRYCSAPPECATISSRSGLGGGEWGGASGHHGGPKTAIPFELSFPVADRIYRDAEGVGNFLR